jgi:hypothetical protein
MSFELARVRRVVAACVSMWAAGVSMAGPLLDQSSPRFLTGPYAATYSCRRSYAWQQEFRCSRTGQLSRVEITCGGPAQSEVRVRIRVGTASKPGVVLCDTRLIKQTTGYEAMSFDLQPFRILAPAGQPFVLEVLSGAVSGATLVGNATADQASALYPYPLYYAGVVFGGAAWRLGFDLELIPDVCVTDINADGGIDAADLELFFGLWENGDAAADANQDGGLDVQDVTTFLSLWSQAAC